MGFSEGLYEYDRSQEVYEGSLADGAYLYRLASLSHCAPEHLLCGKGPMFSNEDGRFNNPQQRTTYCANNVLVCIAEILFHMHEKAIKSIEERKDYSLIRRCIEVKRCLAIVRVNRITDLVHMDCEGVAADFDARMRGTASVFPAATYKLFQEFHNRLRRDNKKGIIYPSARHSRDVCFALFHDETDKLVVDSCRMLPIELRLIAEDQDLHCRPRHFTPFADKIHPTMGFYEFMEAGSLAKMDGEGHINPSGISASGMVDFVRRPYRTYPTSAVCDVG